MDAEYEGQISKAAESALGLKTARVSFSRQEFTRVNALRGPYDAPAFWGPHWEVLEEPAKSVCSENALDALIVAARGKSNDIFGGTNQWVFGAGSYARGNASLVHLLATVALLDCKTGKPLAIRTLGDSPESSNSIKRPLPPAQPLANEISRKPIVDWSAEQREELRKQLVLLPKEAWEPMLRTIAKQK